MCRICRERFSAGSRAPAHVGEPTRTSAVTSSDPRVYPRTSTRRARGGGPAPGRSGDGQRNEVSGGRPRLDRGHGDGAEPVHPAAREASASAGGCGRAGLVSPRARPDAGSLAAPSAACRPRGPGAGDARAPGHEASGRRVRSGDRHPPLLEIGDRSLRGRRSAQDWLSRRNPVWHPQRHPAPRRGDIAPNGRSLCRSRD